MQELKFVRTEEGSLVVADEVGELYKVIVDDAVLSGIRHLARGDQHSKASPKAIQALIRAGKSTAEVAALTGADLSDVERFEVPVIAEREFILENALRVSVVADQSDAHGSLTTFGAAMHQRFESLGAHSVAWAAWRDEVDGWLIAADFTSHDVAHHALWKFDHKKSVLAPHNEDATTLSKQGVIGDRLIPKLRAVETVESNERFDSGAFRPDIQPSTTVDTEVIEPEMLEYVDVAEELFDSPDEQNARRTSIEELAVTRDDEPVDFGQTADLLDALRRRRGQRDSGPQPVVSSAPDVAPTLSATPEASAVTTDRADDPAETQPLEADANDSGKLGNRRGRQGVPSWDDILFGTRSDEDPSDR
jgi:hypothetical protein